MYFRSKKDLRYTLIFLMPIFAPIFMIILIVFSNSEIYSNLNVFGYLMATLLIVLIGLYVWIWLQTGYKIEERKIKIRSGPFRKSVKIEEINKINTSKISYAAISPFSGPALSIERLEINYGKHHDVINVSPASRKDFVKILLAENPDIQTDANVAH